MLTYVTAIVRVYNLYGRRDNKYKARIKILVHETGVEPLVQEIDAEWEQIRYGDLKLPQRDIVAIESYFRMPDLPQRPEGWEILAVTQKTDADFAAWTKRNVTPHKNPDYAVVTISLKPIGGIPGDASAEQMELVADIAETYSFDEIRVSHEQNLVLPHVAKADLPAVYDLLQSDGLVTANAGLITDIIACPGLDYCALANARSIPVAQRISERFGDQQRQLEIGDLKIKISGCINACGHHHVGHIGILGVEKKGEELYQITLGGSGDENSSIGDITGRGFSSEEVVDAIETVVDTYLGLRANNEETFLAAYRRVGMEPFKRALYGEVSRAA
jgi:sulfite reductase (NADPH) hemoprotein beta-component